jgi:hypothetical protein
MFKRFVIGTGLTKSAALAAMLAHPDADGAMHVLRVHNAGSHTVAQLFVRPSASVAWGPDRLAEPLHPDAYVDLVLSATECTYDVRAVYAGGREHGVTDLDVRVLDVKLTY